MPVNKKKIAKNAIMLYFRMGVVLIVSLFTARVVLQQLGASDYGTYNVVGGVVTMFNFMTSALSQGVQRFYNYHKGIGNSDEVNRVFSASFIIMLCVALVVIFLAETIGLWFLNAKMNIPADRMYAANWVYQFSVLTMVFALLIVPHNALIVAHEDFNIYAYISIAVALCNLGIAFLLKYTSSDKLIYYAGLICALHIANSLALFLITRIKYKKYRFVFHREKSVYVSLLSFSGWNILGVATNTLSTTGINIVLNLFFGTIVNAARGIAVQISSKVDDFIHNIQVAMNPQIVQTYARGEIKELQFLLDDNFRWNFSLYWLIALPLLFELDYILELWLGEVPPYTNIFTCLIVIRSFLKCFERPINSLNFAIGDMRPVNIIASSTVLLAFIVTCFLFVIGLPPYWAFVLDIIAIGTYVTFFIVRAQHKGVFSVSHFIYQIIIPICVVIIASSTLTFLIRLIPMHNVLKLFITLATTTFFSGGAIFFILLTTSNRAMLMAKLLKRKG